MNNTEAVRTPHRSEADCWHTGEARTTCSATWGTDPLRVAYCDGRMKALSLSPGKPRVGAASYPTADERVAYVDGWYAGRREQRGEVR